LTWFMLDYIPGINCAHLALVFNSRMVSVLYRHDCSPGRGSFLFLLLCLLLGLPLLPLMQILYHDPRQVLGAAVLAPILFKLLTLLISLPSFLPASPCNLVGLLDPVVDLPLGQPG
jgi:hypothetical protein